MTFFSFNKRIRRGVQKRSSEKKNWIEKSNERNSYVNSLKKKKTWKGSYSILVVTLKKFSKVLTELRKIICVIISKLISAKYVCILYPLFSNVCVCLNRSAVYSLKAIMLQSSHKPLEFLSKAKKKQTRQCEKVSIPP